MSALVFCYAHEDEAAARELAAFLEANLDYQVSLEECRVRPDFDLTDAAERALSADAALVLLSPASVPKAWKREKWEPVFFAKAEEFGTPLGFALLGDCRFPELLRRRWFFDLSRDFRQGSREVKHWLMKAAGPAVSADVFPELRAAVADRPGCALDVAPETAHDFASACAGDFEGVFRIACHGRGAAGILGDIGHAASVRLAGNIEQNRAALTELCRTCRWLFVLAGLAPEYRGLVQFGGRSSVLVTADTAEPARIPLDQICAAFLIADRDQDQCASLVGPATAWTHELLREDFAAALRLGWALVSVLKAAARFAECIELLAAMEATARLRGDEMALFKIEWEQSWMCEDSEVWGVRILPTAGDDIAQLSLF